MQVGFHTRTFQPPPCTKAHDSTRRAVAALWATGFFRTEVSLLSDNERNTILSIPQMLVA